MILPRCAQKPCPLRIATSGEGGATYTWHYGQGGAKAGYDQGRGGCH